jgi:hypothetical protein
MELRMTRSDRDELATTRRRQADHLPQEAVVAQRGSL